MRAEGDAVASERDTHAVLLRERERMHGESEERAERLETTRAEASRELERARAEAIAARTDAAAARAAVSELEARAAAETTCMHDEIEAWRARCDKMQGLLNKMLEAQRQGLSA